MIYHRQEFSQSANEFEKLKVKEPEDFLAATTARGMEALIRDLQVKKYEETKAEVALKPIHFSEVQNWELEVLRWRLRGLSEKEFDNMIQDVGSDVVAAVFQLARYQRPVTARNVIPSEKID